MKKKKNFLTLSQFWLYMLEIFGYYFIFAIVGALAAIRCLSGCSNKTSPIDNVATLLLIPTFLAFAWARWSERKRWEK
jgi:hypothetical protein